MIESLKIKKIHKLKILMKGQKKVL